MTVYVVTLLLVAILGGMEYQQRMADTWYLEDDSIYQKKNNFYYLLIVCVFFFVGGFRYRVGTDFGTYYAGYDATFPQIFERFRTFDEPGIYLLTHLCRMIWNEGTLVIFVENAVTVLLVFKGIRDQENDSWTMPFLLYILYCGWTGSFNGVRQALAAAIIFAFSRRAEKFWVLKYALVCFIAFLVHKSAIFMFPILVLANRKIDFRQVVIIVAAAIAMPYVGSFALDFIGDSLDNGYALHAVNTIRILVSAAPLILLAFTDDSFRNENCFIINMAIFNAVITASTRNSALMYRFSDYTDMYLMLFVPKLAYLFSGSSKRVFRVVVLALYFVYFMTEINSGNGHLNEFQWAFGHFGGL